MDSGSAVDSKPTEAKSTLEPGGSQGDTAPARGQWTNKTEFVLSCISLSVGLGNVWRFPYLAYTYGGGAFLIPYICVLFLVGKPMYFMEIAFGQYHAEGPVKIWKRVVPIAKGIGIAQVLICLFIAIYYIIIMAWTMYYFWATLIAAFKGEDVPWANFCQSEWAHTPSCITPKNLGRQDGSELATVIPTVIFTNMSTDSNLRRESGAQQYFDRAVLMKYDQGQTYKYNLNNMGSVNLPLLACVAGSWLIVFISLVKGVKSSGKAVYVTATMPFVVLFILLGRGASLPNALEGIKYFIVPNFERLLDIQTWKAAAEQMFYSLAVAFGSLTMLGSYNSFNNNCYQDGIIVSVLDTLTSVTAGLAMFSVLGYLAGQQDVGVENVVASGPGLAFVTFPEALSQMPIPHLWAILFFIMLFTLGVGTQIGLMESVITFVCDRFPQLRKRRPLTVTVIVGLCFLTGLPFITQGGSDLFDIFNEYAGGIALLFVGTFEVVCIMWIYGLKRFINNLTQMLGEKGKMSLYWKTAWICTSPFTLIFILFVALINYKQMSNEISGLPAYADGIGWVLLGLCIIQLPIWA
ncbi:Sodium- and chloride-dependent glycine transporter 2 [Hypsibius exemplaris]|uniref:Transporter n=1 Tax=Hypsibius exemplaris TaxID=2072580 RepID=A0A1W0WVF2_HYPEX|nr:Sodium- and chloride-dependent glycine transporter 2 [Hypsibius exemplaris]